MAKSRLHAQARNRLISIQRRTDSGEGSWGQPRDAWVQYRKLWASIRFASGMGFASNEGVQADREASRSVASFRVAYREDIDPGSMRVVHRGRIFDIVEVLPDEVRKEYIDIAVTTGVSEG